MGETLSQFVKRSRLEQALYLMSHTANRSLTQIALECGFGSSAEFDDALSSFVKGPNLDRLAAGQTLTDSKCNLSISQLERLHILEH